MTLSIPELTIGAVPVLLLVMALVQVIKIVFKLEDENGETHRAVPLIAIGLGVLFAIGIQLSSVIPGFAAWYEMIVAGIVVGLAAIGLYSGGKHTLNLGG